MPKQRAPQPKAKAEQQEPDGRPNRLRELREKKGLKPYDVAARYRKDPSTVYAWESGRSTIPDEIKLDLADFYGVTVAHLMGWPEKVAA